MRLLQLHLRDFRGVAEADVEFAPTGVTIVSGPNEVGKSSLIDALDMLITDPDSSSKARVRDSKPVNRDVGPWARAVIESGPYRFTYAKRWVKSPTTELTIHAPREEQVTGRAAHDRVVEILDETMDADLFSALRHQQGLPLDQAALGTSGSLARALDAAAGAGAAAGEPDAPLIDAIEQERARWTTPTGEPNKARKDLIEAAREAQDVAAEAEQALADVDEQVDEHRRLEQQVRRSVEQEPTLRERLAAAEAAQVEAMRREARVSELEASSATAAGPAREAALAVERRAALIAAAAASEQEVVDAMAEGAEDGARLDAARTACDAARAGHDDATAARVRADDALTAAAEDADHLDDLYYVRAYGERLEVATAAADRIQEGEQFLADCAITPDLLERIERAADSLARAEARRDASAADVRVVAERDIRVDAADGVLDVAAGDAVTVPVNAGGTFGIEGVARVTVGDADSGDATDVERAARGLADLLREAGLPDGSAVEQARALEQSRRDVEARVAAERLTRSRALDDLSIEDLADKLARARERVSRFAEECAPGRVLPADQAAAAAARDAAGLARDEARRAEETAQAARDEAEQAVSVLERAAAERTGVLGTLVKRRDADAAALSVARAEHTDAALDDAAARASATAHAAEEEAATARARRDPGEVEAITVRVASAREALTRLLDERQDAEVRVAGLAGGITRAGADGLADRVADAHEKRDAAAAARDRALRQAEAAELLHRVMLAHRDDAQRAYVAPFREAMERLGRMVFGGGVRVDVDHATLQVTSRTHDGVTVAVDALSGGAREQMAVIGRLAAASLVAGDDGGAPVIIDDALGYSDLDRLGGLGAALTDVGRTSQVIVLTCMPDRYSGIGAAHTVRL